MDICQRTSNKKENETFNMNDLSCKSCGASLTLLYLNTNDQILACTNHLCFFPFDQPVFDKYIYDSKMNFNLFIQQLHTETNNNKVDINMKDTNVITNDEDTGIFGDDFF